MAGDTSAAFPAASRARAASSRRMWAQRLRAVVRSRGREEVSRARRALSDADWTKVRQAGSHETWRSPDATSITVAGKGSRPFRSGGLAPSAGCSCSICDEGRSRHLRTRYPEFDGRLQPDVYRLLWAPSPLDARIRGVGTLTREDRTSNRTPARLVAESLIDAIDSRISPTTLSNADEASFFAQHEGTLNAVVLEVDRLLSATGPARKIRGKAYFGWRLPLPSRAGQPLLARRYLSPAGTRLNLPGAPDALIAAPERDATGRLSRERR